MTSARASATRCLFSWRGTARLGRLSKGETGVENGRAPAESDLDRRLQSKRDILLDRHVREERIVLKDHAKAAVLRGLIRNGAGVVAEREQDFAGVGASANPPMIPQVVVARPEAPPTSAAIRRRPPRTRRRTPPDGQIP